MYVFAVLLTSVAVITYAHTAAAGAAVGRTAPSTNHHRAPTMHMFTASAGGAGR